MLKKGYSVIEVLLAGTIFALAASGIAAAIIFSQRSGQTAAAKERSLTLAEEGMVAVRSIRDRDSDAFTSLPDDPEMALTFSGGEWTFITDPQAGDDTVNGYVRRVAITDLSVENTQKQVTVTVTYPTNQSGGTGTVSLVEQFGNIFQKSVTGATMQSQNYLLAADILGSYEESLSPGSNELSGIGEAGTFTSSNSDPDGTWTTINFNGQYDNPVVFGRTNTDDSQENALVFETRSVTSTSAEMRLCLTPEVVDGCGNHTDELAGYIVFDLDDLNGLSGVEAGVISTSAYPNSNWDRITYVESFLATPIVFVTPQLTSTHVNRHPIVARLDEPSITGIDIALCHSDNDDACASNYPTTQVAWIAIDPSNIPFDQNTGMGRVTTNGDTWEDISYTGFSGNPVVLSENQTNNGAQNGEVNEVRNITSTGAQVRFCEVDITFDRCDAHTNEETGWIAIGSGSITAGSSSGSSEAVLEYRLGESGTFQSTNGAWTTITYDEYTSPVIVGTSQSESTDPSLVFEVRNVSTTSAEVRLCDSDGVGVIGCGTSGTESGGYIVIDAVAASFVNGIEAGTFSQSGGFPDNTTVVNMTETLSSPIVFGAVQNTGQGTGQVDSPVEVRVLNPTESQFESGLCFHDDTNENACETSYGSAQIGWIALSSGINLFNQGSEVSSVSEANSLWASVTFGASFSQPPIVIVENQTNSGAENGEINEARNITLTGAEVRFCEMDANVCNTHAAEDIGWVAVPPGFLTISQ